MDFIVNNKARQGIKIGREVQITNKTAKKNDSDREWFNSGNIKEVSDNGRPIGFFWENKEAFVRRGANNHKKVK